MLDYLRIAGVTLHATSGPRSIVDATGLVGIPTVRGDVYAAADRDGAVEPARQLLDAKTMVLQGETWAPSGLIADAWVDWDVIAGAIVSCKDTPQLLQWQRAGDGLAFQRYVRLAGPLEPPISDGQPVLQYQATLRAADPAALSQTTKSATQDPTGAPGSGLSWPLVWPLDFGGSGGAALTLVNDGNYDARPVYTLTGPWSGNPFFTNGTSGKTFRTSGLSLTTGSQLVVDTGQRTVTLDGSDASGLIDWAASDWPTLSPGGNVILLGGVPSAGSLFAASFQSAYVS